MSRWPAVKRHLAQADPVLGRLIRIHGMPSLLDPKRARVDLFDSLVNAIISQQVSTAAARTIRLRLHDLVGANQFSAEILNNAPESDLRSRGLSGSKCRYIKSLAASVTEEPALLEDLRELEDDSIIERLTTFKGIGTWTAQMLLIFGFERMDIFAPNDAGLIKGVRISYFDGEHVSIDEIELVTSMWKPYRSIGSWYMWQVANTERLSRV